MVIRFLTIQFRTLLFTASMCSAAFAQVGGPEIGHAISEVKTIDDRDLSALRKRVQQCYHSLPGNSDVGKVAYCFALDFGASLLRDKYVNAGDVESIRYLTIEKVLTRANLALSARKVEQAERGILIAYWVKASIEMLRVRKKSIGQMEGQQLLDDARRAILSSVKDPVGAKVIALRLITTPNARGEPTEVVCGKIAERRSARIMPFRRFVYFVSEKSITYDDGSEDIRAHIVNNFCEG